MSICSRRERALVTRALMCGPVSSARAYTVAGQRPHPGADLLKQVSGTGRTAPVAEARVRGRASAQLSSSSTSSEWGLWPLRQFHVADARRVPGAQIGGDGQRTDVPNLAVLCRARRTTALGGRRLGAQARPGIIRCRFTRYERSRHGRPRPHPGPCGAAAAPRARRRHRRGAR